LKTEIYKKKERNHKLKLSFYIAKRYAVSFSKNKAINIITGIASVGIIASSMALFVFLSVFSGLKEFSLNFANVSDPDLRVETTLGKTFFVNQKQEELLFKSKYIASLFGDVNEIEVDGKIKYVYPHQFIVVPKSELEVEIVNCYYKGSHYLAEAQRNEAIIFFENPTEISIGTKIYLEIKNPEID
jgi:hypothetical protein